MANQQASVSEVAICNQAMILLAENTITSFADAGNNAKICNALYAIQRDACLAEGFWRFAKTRIQIAKDGTNPAFGWDFRYPIPPDYIRALMVNDKDIRFEREGRFILCDEGSPINLIYIKREMNTALMHPLFIDALAHRIAWKAAFAVTRQRTMAETMYNLYTIALARAESMDAMEGPPDIIQSNELIDARLT